MHYIKKHPVQIRVTESFLSTWAFMKVARLGTGNVFTLLLFLLIYLFYNTLDQHLLSFKQDTPSGTEKRSMIVSFTLGNNGNCTSLFM